MPVNTTNQQIDAAIQPVAAQLPITPPGAPRRDLTNAVLKSLLGDIQSIEQNALMLDQVVPVETSQDVGIPSDAFLFERGQGVDSEVLKQTRSQLFNDVVKGRQESSGLFAMSVSDQLITAAIFVGSSAIEKDRATDKQREFYEAIRYPAVHFDPEATDDLGDGSKGRPYRDLTGARLLPGRRHLIKAGVTIVPTGGGTWITIPATGTEQAPIVIGRYGAPHLPDPVIDGSALNKVFRGGTGARHYRIRDLEIVGPKVGSNRYAVSQQSLAAVEDAQIPHHIVLARLHIHGVTSDGATDCNAIKLYGADNVVLDCDIHDISDDGIWFHGYRTLIGGCTIYRIGQSNRIAGDCVQCGAKSDQSVVRACYLDHFEADFKQCIYFEQTISISDSVLIEDCYCVSADGTEGAAGPIVCGATNSTVRRCFTKGGRFGIQLGVGSVAYSNVVISTVGRGIDCAANAGVYHNTIIQTGNDTSQSWSIGVRLAADAAGVSVRHNVLIGQYNGILSLGTNVPDEFGNAFAIRGVSNAMLRINGAVVPPTNPIIGAYASWGADLGLDVNMRPVTGSPLLGVAAEIEGLDGLDKDQRRVTRAVGAYW